ncbi:MAG TPA: hypothetical protein VN913_02405 [Candidatus Binatus sp.]|nr:hypothetical protein [Candidatus Binatus sp.]
MPVEVRCTADGQGYRCAVDVSDATGSSHHVVRVSAKDFERWSRGRSAEELVADSFSFLLGREPKESILRGFDLSVIKRYFPDYDGG